MSPIKPELFNLSGMPDKQPASNSLFEEFCHSAAYAGLQQPVTGISQIVDKVAGTKLEQNTAFMEAPREAEFGTARWHAQTIGGAAGGLVPLLISARVAKSALAGEGGFLSRRAVIGLSLKESAATGFIADSVFRPSSNNGDFLKERLIAGAGGSLTFTSMTAASLGLGALSQSAMANSMRMSGTLRNPVVSGILSGVPGGAVSSDYESLVHKGRLSTGSERAQSVYSMSLIGGAFGLKHQIQGAKPETVQQKVQKSIGPSLASEVTAAPKAKTEPVQLTEAPTVEPTIKSVDFRPTSERFQRLSDSLEALDMRTSSLMSIETVHRKQKIFAKGFIDESYGGFERMEMDPFISPKHYRLDRYERFETAAEKLTNDTRYAAAKTVLQQLEQSGGKPIETVAARPAETTQTQERTQTANQPQVAGEARTTYPISLEEARALYALEKRNPTEAKRMVELLGTRGPEVEHIAGNIGKSLVFGEFSKSDLQHQFDLGHAFFESMNVLKEAKVEEAKRTENATGVPAEATVIPQTVQTISVTEAKALLTLKEQNAFSERYELEQILDRRGPVAKWVCHELMREHDFALKHMIGSSHLSAIQGAVPKGMTQERVDNLFKRGENSVAAEQVYEQTWKVRTQDRPAHTGPYPLSLAEANAIATLTVERSDHAVSAVKAMVAQRGPHAVWIAEKLVETHDKNRYSTDKKAVSVSDQDLANLARRAGPAVEALQVMERVSKEDPSDAAVKGKPVSMEEATAVRVLHKEDQKLAMQLTESIGRRGPETEYVIRQIKMNRHPEVTEQTLLELRSDSRPFVDAMNLIATLKKGDKSLPDTSRSAETVTVEEIKALFVLAKEPGNHEKDMLRILQERGPGAAYVGDALLQIRHSLKTEELVERHVKEITDLGTQYEKALDVLNKLKTEEAEGAPKGETTPISQTNRPLSLEEAQAIAALEKSNHTTDATNLVQIIAQRGDQQRWEAHWIVEKGFNAQPTEQSLRFLNTAYEVDQVLKGSTEYQERTIRFDPYDLVTLSGITTKAEVLNLIETWNKIHPKTESPQSMPNLSIVVEMSRSPHVRSVSDVVIGGIYDHIRLTGKSYNSEVSPERLENAGVGWQVAPGMPIALAADVGTMPPQRRIAAAVAFDSLLKDHQITDVKSSSAQLESNDFSRQFYTRLQELSTEGRAALVNRMPSSSRRALPTAIEAIHGKALTPEGQAGLALAVKGSDNPFQMLLGVKGAHFTDALDHLTKVSEGTKQSGDAQWAAKTALQVTATFKGGWQGWLASQAKIGRNAHDGTYFLPFKPAGELKGLGQFLLDNSNRAANDLQLVAGRWSEVPEEVRTSGFKDVKEHLMTNKYAGVVSKEFATEAGQWGMAPVTYKERETRYRASLAVPVPFDLEKRWTVGELTGRFLPRTDTRGLFVGNHTNCCQHPDGAAAQAAWYGQESPRSGVFVVENKANEIVAESWAWISNDRGMAFDNVEAKGIGNRTADVQKIYQQAANDLSHQFYRITLGTGHSDLETSGWKAAGDKALKLPSDYSGYTDATNQVILAENPNLKPAKDNNASTVRGALLTDVEALEKISKARYPEGWQHVPLDGNTRGLVVEEPGKGVVGYALIEPENRYISDVAVMPDSSPQKTVALLKALTTLVKQSGGEWRADARDSTSYKLLQSLARKGTIEIISDHVSGKMGSDDMHAVVFRAANNLKVASKPGKSAARAILEGKEGQP